MRRVISNNVIARNSCQKGPQGDLSWQTHGEEEDEYAKQNSQPDHGIPLFGRVTYEMMASYWPTPDALKNNPIVVEGMNKAEKMVFSRTLSSVEWRNTRLVNDNLEEEIRRLKQQPGKNIAILGSGSIVTQLAEKGLIDEYPFISNPMVFSGSCPSSTTSGINWT